MCLILVCLCLAFAMGCKPWPSSWVVRFHSDEREFGYAAVEVSGELLKNLEDR